MIENIASGFELLFQLQPLAYLALGVVIGFIVGALPGFESSNAAALVLPLALTLEPAAGVIFIAAIYASAHFAGAMPAIILNVPGTPGAAATALDGYPLSQQGKPGLAIGIARTASTLGGLIASVVVLLVIGPLGAAALTFRSPETFLAAFVGILVIGSVFGGDKRKGLVAALLGFLIASMSANPNIAQGRLTFGFTELYSEVPFIPALIGMFALTEMLLLARRNRVADAAAGGGAGNAPSGSTLGPTVLRDAVQGFAIAVRQPFNVLRSSAIGMAVGIVPGMGTTIGNFLAYDQAKRAAKDRRGFGKGDPRGIVASEAADNAVTSATLVPTLTLGIPGSGTAAVMLTALLLQGMVPGPGFIESHTAEAYAILGSLLLISVLILPLGTLLAAPLAGLVRVRTSILVPSVCLLALVGAYAVRSSVFDVGLAIVFGLLGLLLRTHGYPVVPVVLGMVLAPIAEDNFLRSMALSGNNPVIFVETLTGRLLVALLFVVLLINAWLFARKRAQRP